MTKLTDARLAALKALYETGDTPSEANFATVFDYIQGGIESHDHAGLGDGDAATIAETGIGSLVVALSKRQGGSATDWHTGGTTDYTPGAVRMQAGAVAWIGAAATTGAKTVTFPTAFSYVPLVFGTVWGYESGQYVNLAIVVTPGDVDADSVDLYWRDVASATHTALTLFWVAIGTE